MEIYRQHIDELVPDVNNNGLVIIDFESWRPIFRQNFGVLVPYKDVSYQIERERHPFWLRQQQEAEVRTLETTLCKCLFDIHQEEWKKINKSSLILPRFLPSNLQAEKRFESAGRKYVEETLKLSRNLRPKAKWGYYAFPYCFNKGLNVNCPSDVKKENDR